MVRDCFSGMTDDELKEKSIELFKCFRDSGRRLVWLAEYCGVTRQTAWQWEKHGAPKYILLLMSDMLFHECSCKKGNPC